MVTFLGGNSGSGPGDEAMVEGASWNVARVLALAPDPASAKAGQGLTSIRQWANLGQAANLVWGECQGSGSRPYQCKVAPDDPAFACSCPSRKFPCKHALGLLLIWSGSDAAIEAGEPPGWVATWVESRAKRAEAKQEKADLADAVPVDSAARLKREASRLAKVSAGLDDLDIWLGDLVRSGFSALATRPGKLWDEQARRMVDAQCPGVARRLRQIDAMPRAGAGWQGALLDRLAQIHLLIEGFRRRDRLPAEVLEDVRAAIGFPADLDGVRAGTAGVAVRDTWQVLGQAYGLEEKIAVRRTWLWGQDTRRAALVLDFAAPGRPFEAHFEAGTALDATLGFLPGAAPLRALPLDRHGPARPFGTLGGGSVADAHTSFGAVLARSPWVELIPLVLGDITLWPVDGGWSAVDPSGAVLPLGKRFDQGWHVEAISGGSPLTLMGEFDGATLRPFGVVCDGRYLPLTGAMTSVEEDPPAGSPGSWLTPETALLRDAAAAAVVGVDRKAPPVPADQPLGRPLAPLQARPAAARLLALAAAGGLYARVGRMPRVAGTDHLPSVALAEDRPEASPGAVALLQRLFAGDCGASPGGSPDLFLEWFDLCLAADQRLPHALLAPVMTTFQGWSGNIRVLVPILGRRGRWLAARNPQWAHLAELDRAVLPAEVWETGTRAARLALLTRLRADDPTEARRLVASTFAAEPAALRAEIVARFDADLTDADEPFLEAALDDRSKEVREGAADLLPRLPDSRFVGRMIERTQTLLAWEGDRLAIHLPGPPDPAMIRDGIASQSSHENRASLLRSILALTPIAAVAEHLGRPPEVLIPAVEGSEWASPVIEAWEASALLHRDLVWCRALALARIEARTIHQCPRFSRLFATLPGDVRDALIAERLGSSSSLGDRSPGEAHRFIEAARGTFGVDLARTILRRIVAEVAEKERIPRTDSGLPTWDVHKTRILMDQVADRLPFELVDETVALANDQLGSLPTGDPHHSLKARFEAMLDRWKFRRDLHQEFLPR